MKAGELVFHIDDIRCEGIDPAPGLITSVRCDFSDDEPEAIVFFTDRSFGEYHRIKDLIRVEDHREGEQ
tara:strand:+ start:227 stop:433 length:207 start_codon:yes stop_codon:yes gene_type:complete